VALATPGRANRPMAAIAEKPARRVRFLRDI
jgi:hypothetical protein